MQTQRHSDTGPADTMDGVCTTANKHRHEQCDGDMQLVEE